MAVFKRRPAVASTLSPSDALAEMPGLDLHTPDKNIYAHTFFFFPFVGTVSHILAIHKHTDGVDSMEEIKKMLNLSHGNFCFVL